MNGMKKRFRVRQTIGMWYGFYQCPNPYGEGWVPLKSAGVHNRESKIACLYRVETMNKNKYHLRKRNERRTD